MSKFFLKFSLSTFKDFIVLFNLIMEIYNAANISGINLEDALFVKSLWCSESWSEYKVIILGMNSFHRLLTFSKFIGFLFWGIVELTTCSFAKISPTSPISDLCRR